MKKTRLVVGIIACVLAAVLAGCSGATGGVGLADFQGSWELESADSTVGTTSADMVAQVKDLGLVCTLDMNEDGTLTLDLFGDTMSGTWEVVDSGVASVVLNDTQSSATIDEEGKLVMGTNDDTLVFVRPNL